MRLPVAIQTAFEESERQFQAVLSRLGLTREQLIQVADKIKTKKTNTPQVSPVATLGKRVIHV